MTTPVAGFASIKALAAHLGVRFSTVHRRVSSLRVQGLPITVESVRDWTPPPRSYEPSPVKRAVMRGAASALAKKAGCTPGAMRERLRRGQSAAQAVAPREARGWDPYELMIAAEKASPGLARGAKAGLAVRKHLRAGLTLAQALDAETARAWQRIEARRAA